MKFTREQDRIMLDNDGFNLLCKARYGYFLYNKHDVFIGKSLEAYGEWSEPEVELLATICHAGDHIIEAGSNIGTHTVPLARMAGPHGRVYAFEAQRVVFQTLCANIALNSLDNVECYHMAVGEKNGQLLVPDTPCDHEQNFGGMRVSTHNYGRKIPLVSLDGFLELPSLKLIKADIEGMEYQLLKGADSLLKTHRPFLYLESEPKNPDTPQLVKMLMDRAYSLYWHVPRLFNPDNYAGNPENIFASYASFNLLCVPEGATFDNTVAGQALKKLRTPDDKPF